MAEPTRSRKAPVRLVHLGLGAFHRAHQAWYTDVADDGWGIAAFTGRSPDAARTLAAQDGLYVLIERAADGDAARLVQSIVAAHDGADTAAWRAAVADPAVAVVTLTVTEAGYHATAAGELDTADPDVRTDLRELRAGGTAVTAPGRLVDGLRARRAAGAGPVALVSCDNLSANGQVLARVVRAIAQDVDPGLATWVDANVSFVSTMVDRITPATTDEDRAVALRLTGLRDRATVVTEPFTEWVLSGAFPAGRPAWERAGARFVDDLEPYEQRKLWLLNAAHSLLAYRGSLQGHTTVADAFADPDLAAEVEALWSEARDVLPLPEREVDDATAALRERFANPRIRHTLSQVGTDGSFKLGPRVLEPLRRRLAAGLPVGTAQPAALAAWATCLERLGPTDEASRPLATTLRAGGGARDVLAALAPDLADDDAVVEAVDRRLAELRAVTPTGRH